MLNVATMCNTIPIPGIEDFCLHSLVHQSKLYWQALMSVSCDLFQFWYESVHEETVRELLLSNGAVYDRGELT